MRPLDLITLFCALSLGACTSVPTQYAPAPDGGHGYSQQRIEADRYRITFMAGGDKSISEVEDMALRRAAEVTLEQGAEWFLVVDKNVADEGGSVLSPTIGVGHSFGSRYSGSSIGLGIRINPDAGEKHVILEILIRSGEISDDQNAYFADEILDQVVD